MARKRGSTDQRRNRKVHRRDQRMCQYCGAKLAKGSTTVDHVVPLSRGGSKLSTNLVTACSPCNTRKADRTPDEAGMPLLSEPCPEPDFGPQRGMGDE